MNEKSDDDISKPEQIPPSHINEGDYDKTFLF